MFAPSQHDVRRFFCDVHRKRREGLPLTPIETLAGRWVDEHPEYHAELGDVDAALAASYTVEAGRTNPFLHLSMHVSIAEQLSIDQPRGIAAAHREIVGRATSDHDALHAVLECLGETVWRAQRDRAAPDEAAYLECIRRRAT